MEGAIFFFFLKKNQLAVSSGLHIISEIMQIMSIKIWKQSFKFIPEFCFVKGHTPQTRTHHQKPPPLCPALLNVKIYVQAYNTALEPKPKSAPNFLYVHEYTI